MSNPYTLVFGQPPLEMIERRAQAERIVSEFCQEHPSNYLNLITGIRGSGKTVFMTQIANRLQEEKDWIVVNLNPQRDLLQSLMAKLSGDGVLSGYFQEAEINLQGFGLSIGVKGAPLVRDVEDALIRMFLSIRKHGKRVLITVDEATNSKGMRIFASTYQLFMREKLPVFLLMTGLYSQIDRLRNAEGMTFLERAPRTELAPLNFTAMSCSYEKTLRLRSDEANRLAKATRGYSFAFQTIGYFVWEDRTDIEGALERSREYLNEFAYQKIWREMSARDRELANAVYQSGDGEVLKVREILQWTTNQFNPYRSRLMKAGILVSPQNGYVALALPWFGEFSAEKTAEKQNLRV